MLYDDLVFPPWLSALGKGTTRSMGFPTAEALRTLACEHGLIQGHLSRAMLDYEVVWRKKGGGEEELAREKRAWEAVSRGSGTHQRV